MKSQKKHDVYAGKLVVINGISCVGKTEIARVVFSNMKKQGHDVLFLEEFSKTPISECLEQVLTKVHTNCMSETLLILSERVERLRKYILPNLKSGRIILSDTYIDMTLPYQLATTDNLREANLIRKVVELVYDKFPEPDIRFFLHASMNTIRNRKMQRDKVETEEHVKFLEKVERNAISTGLYGRSILISTEGNIQQVANEITIKLYEKL